MSDWWKYQLDPPDTRPTHERDLEELQGVWAQVWSTADGSELEEPPGFPVRVSIAGDRFTIGNARSGTSTTYRIQLVPHAHPKSYDLIDDRDPCQIVEAIYELSGDTLRVCQPLAGRPRPARFDAAAGTMNLLILHHRVE